MRQRDDAVAGMAAARPPGWLPFTLNFRRMIPPAARRRAGELRTGTRQCYRPKVAEELRWLGVRRFARRTSHAMTAPMMVPKVLTATSAMLAVRPPRKISWVSSIQQEAAKPRGMASHHRRPGSINATRKPNGINSTTFAADSTKA